jgi:hypothetical protein
MPQSKIVTHALLTCTKYKILSEIYVFNYFFFELKREGITAAALLLKEEK